MIFLYNKIRGDQVKALINKNSSYFFPLVFIILHILTRSIYFYACNSKIQEDWIPANIFLSILIIPNSFIPNFLGLFLIWSLLTKKINRLLLCLYASFLLFEGFLLLVDIMAESIPETAAPQAYYYFLLSFMKYSSGQTRFVPNISIYLASIHILFIFIENKSNTNANIHLQSK